MSSFYEAASVQKHAHSYREVLLCNTNDLTELVRGNRLPHWAVTTLRVDSVPSSLDPDEASIDAVALHCLLVASHGDREFRYDRVIILRTGEDPSLDTTVGFLRQWIPGLLEQGRLFKAELPGGLVRDELLCAIGGAEAVD